MFPEGFRIKLEFGDEVFIDETKDSADAEDAAPVNHHGFINEGFEFTGTARRPLEFSTILLSEVCSLYHKRLKATSFALEQGQRLPSLNLGRQYKVVCNLLGELRKVNLPSLSKEQKLPFWLNVYQALLLFTYTVDRFHPPSNLFEWLKLTKSAMYVIGGQAFSLLQLVTSVLCGGLSVPEWKEDLG